ncbi:MAG: hypothetical protein AAFN77_04470 [Planctomycetota bacterium]
MDRSSDGDDPWWIRLWHSIRRALNNQWSFASGEGLLKNGILFFVEPEDSATLFAATPSSDTSPERIELIIEEVNTALSLFIAENSHLKGLLNRRHLVVRIINHYDDLTPQVPQIGLGQELLANLLAEAPSQSNEYEERTNDLTTDPIDQSPAE